MKPIINCNQCKRPVLEHELKRNDGIGYCYGCNIYFPIDARIKRKREEIIIPNGTSFIRCRLAEDSLEIKIKWFGNFSFKQLIKEILDEEAVGFIYAISAYLFNKTLITADKKVLKIEHKPVEALPFVYYPAKYVRQLYVKEIGVFYKTFALFAKCSDGKEEMLIWDLDKKILLFIEQEIERIFGIEDEAVEEEVT